MGAEKKWARVSISAEKMVKLTVRTDPDPCDSITAALPYRAEIECDACRVKVGVSSEFFETQ